MHRPMRKALHILLILHLSLTTVSVVTRPDTCFCGKACEHSLYDPLKTERDVSYHNRCRGSGCKTCNIERVMNFDPENLHTTGYGRNVCEPGQILIISNDGLFTNHTINRVDLTCSHTPIHSSAIYLQSLSLLL